MARESLGSRFGFLMIAAGCAIGLGNIWRFPYITGRNGGALFVLVYLVFLALIGLPLMIMELSVGRASRKGLYGAFRDLPEKRPSKWRFPAGIAFSGSVILMMMYTTITGWLLYYFVQYLGGSFFALKTPEEIGSFFGVFLDNGKQVVFYMLIAVIIASIVCASGLRNGVERVTKILMSLLFLILLGLFIYSLTLPNAMQGIKTYLVPNTGAFSNNFSQVIADAMTQAFFTLSIGCGAIAIFGSYCDKKRSLTGEAAWIIVFDTLVALLAGGMIFAICASFHINVDGGPNLIFISFPQMLNNMPGGAFIGVVFFLFMSIAAMTTVIAVFENLISFMIDEWKFSRIAASAVNCAVISLLSLPCSLGFNVWKNVHPLGGNSNFLDLEDWLISDIILPLGSVLIVIFCTWKSVWGFEKFRNEANIGDGIKVSRFPYLYLKFILPVLIFCLFCIAIYSRFFK